MSEQLRDIVIVGGGLAGWYAAVRLAHAMRGRRIKLRVVHAAAPGEEADPLDALCASTLPSHHVAHAELGLDERAFMRVCRATFKLATEYRGLTDPSRSYLLPHGEIGARIEAVGFHQVISRLAHAGRALDIDEFSVPALAARLGRFAHPSPDARSVLSTFEYAYHLDTQAYTRLLRAFAQKLGAVAVDAGLAGVELAADGQNIAAVTLTDGQRLEGDLFIDCSGARSALLGEALGVPFDSWQSWLPCDRAVVMGVSAFEPPAPFTRISAEPGGWSWQVPLRDQLVQGLVFDGSRVDADAALAKAAQAQSRAVALRFTNGRRREAWRGNCVAIGAAAGFLEPLASTGLQLINEGVTRLLSLFPDRGSAAVMAVEYNRMLAALYDGARDFVLLHYLLARRAEAPWNGEVAAALPPSLARRVEMFRHRGRVVLNDDEIFEEPDWACTFVGQGEKPLHHSIIVDQASDAEVLAQVAKIARVMQSAVQTLPPHHAYLERYLA